jgi:hypothetical protein
MSHFSESCGHGWETVERTTQSSQGNTLKAVMTRCAFPGCGKKLKPYVSKKLLAKFGKAQQVCRGHIIANFGSDLVEVEGPGNLLRLANDHYVPGTTDLSGHQDDLKWIIANLKENGVDVDDEVVKEDLLDLLTTSHWDERRDYLQSGKTKKIPYNFFLKRQTLSLRDQAAAMITLKCTAEATASKVVERKESGEHRAVCKGCHAKGVIRSHVAVFSNLKAKYNFSCPDCLFEILTQLCETNSLLSFFPVGPKGVFLYQNPVYDPSSTIPFCREEIICHNVNLKKGNKHPAILLLAAGLDPSTNKDEFLKNVAQMVQEYNNSLQVKRDYDNEKRQSFNREQATILTKVYNNIIPSLPSKIVSQKVEQFDKVVDNALTRVSGDPVIGMCNSSSLIPELIDGQLSTSIAEKEHIRKLISQNVAMILTPSGDPLSQGKDFILFTDLDEFEAAGTSNDSQIRVFMHTILSRQGHNTVRMAEQQGIETIQRRGKNTPNSVILISSEDPSTFHPGGDSKKYALGEANGLLVVGWYPKVVAGELYLNAGCPPFLKDAMIRAIPLLKDPKYWKILGDTLSLSERLGSNSLTTSQKQQLIISQPTTKQSRKLQELDANALHLNDGNKKQKAIPQKCVRAFFGKKRIVVSGSGVDRARLQATLKAYETLLHLKAVSDFPADIAKPKRAGEYIFVEGANATERKVQVARANQITTWSASDLEKLVELMQ